MPRFYFHLHNDTDVPDLEGREFPDLPAAHAEAIREARVLIGELVKTEAKLVLSHRIDVEDERGAVLTSVYFRDVVLIEA